MFFRRSEDDTFLYSIFSHNIYRLCLGEMMTTSAFIQTEAGSAGAKSFFYVVLLALITAILCLLFGFDTAVINSVLLFIRHEFALNNLQTETAASSLLLGCLIGKAAASLIGDRLRRKLSLILASRFSQSQPLVQRYRIRSPASCTFGYMLRKHADERLRKFRRFWRNELAKAQSSLWSGECQS